MGEINGRSEVKRRSFLTRAAVAPLASLAAGLGLAEAVEPDCDCGDPLPTGAYTMIWRSDGRGGHYWEQIPIIPCPPGDEP